MIAGDPEMLAEATRLLPALAERMHRSATKSEIKTVIFARFPLYPQPQRAEWQWDLWWADYFTTLDGLTGEAIDAGLTAWIAKPDSEFLPKPGALKALAASSVTKTGRTMRIVNAAILKAAEPLPSRSAPTARLKHIPKPPEDRQYVQDVMADFRSTNLQREGARPRPVARDMSGPLAPGHHVTQESLDLMRRESDEYDRETSERERTGGTIRRRIEKGPGGGISIPAGASTT